MWRNYPYCKREQQKVVFLERKRFCLIRIQSFPYEKWKGRKYNLKNFKVWGYLVKVQVPIPKRIKIGPMMWTVKLDLSSLEKGLKCLGNEKDNVLNKEIQRLSKM